MTIRSLIAAMGILAVLPHTALALSDEDRDAYTLLLLGPKENQVRTCASAALRLNMGLTALKIARTADDEVESSLMEKATTDRLKADRARAAALWKTTHNPAKVAELEFFSCAKANDIKLQQDSLITTCFSLAGVPALADTLKIAGHPKEYTAAKVVAAYGKQIPEDFMRRVVDNVYLHNPEADNFEAHRQVFAECIHNTPSNVSDEEVLNEYERVKAAMGDKEYHVMHIMVGNKETADQIVARIKNGQAFSELAAVYSQDPGSSEKGGDLGWSTPSAFVPAFAAAVRSTAPGTYAAAPVQTPFGWHVVKVEAVRPMNVPAFELVKGKIRAGLEAKKAKAQ